MYRDYFHLTEMPFSIAPDPRFLYMSQRHREALAHLLYGVQGEGGILLLTGEVGTGKTTLCRCLLEQIQEQCDIAFILNPKMSVEELLAGICDEFHIELPAAAPSVKALVDAINAHLLRANAQGRRAVLIIDEAQNLRADVLEQLRLLTNLETNTRKLLQIILIGQPELQAILRRPDLRQVAQRVVARYHLGHLTRLEVASYVAHRLLVSGTQVPIFPYSLIGPLYRLTGGVPRLINLLCDRALLGTYVQRKLQVTPKILRRAAREVLDTSALPHWWRRPLALPSAILAGVCASGVLAASLLPLWPVSWPQAVAIDAAAASASASVQGRPAPANAAAAGAATERMSLASYHPSASGESRVPDASAPRARSERLAFQDLFKLYGIAVDAEGSGAACQIAETVNMYCRHARGSLADLLRANRPALLLLDGAGTDDPSYAVLAALDETHASVIVAGVRQRVALAQFAPLWSGRYVQLMYAPPGANNALAEGNRGPAVSWLRQALARVQGGIADGPAAFDTELVGRVKAFQFAEGMAADGVAGALTLTRLNLRLEQTLPRLNDTLPGGMNVVHP